MQSNVSKIAFCVGLFLLVIGLQVDDVQARYLPTRGGKMDRLDKLRELLKELLENEIEREEYQADAPPRWHPESKLFYKREVQQEMPEVVGSSQLTTISN